MHRQFIMRLLWVMIILVIFLKVVKSGIINEKYLVKFCHIIVKISIIVINLQKNGSNCEKINFIAEWIIAKHEIEYYKNIEEAWKRHKLKYNLKFSCKGEKKRFRIFEENVKDLRELFTDFMSAKFCDGSPKKFYWEFFLHLNHEEIRPMAALGECRISENFMENNYFLQIKKETEMFCDENAFEIYQENGGFNTFVTFNEHWNYAKNLISYLEDPEKGSWNTYKSYHKMKFSSDEAESIAKLNFQRNTKNVLKLLKEFIRGESLFDQMDYPLDLFHNFIHGITDYKPFYEIDQNFIIKIPKFKDVAKRVLSKCKKIDEKKVGGHFFFRSKFLIGYVIYLSYKYAYLSITMGD